MAALRRCQTIFFRRNNFIKTNQTKNLTIKSLFLLHCTDRFALHIQLQIVEGFDSAWFKFHFRALHEGLHFPTEVALSNCNFWKIEMSNTWKALQWYVRLRCLSSWSPVDQEEVCRALVHRAVWIPPFGPSQRNESSRWLKRSKSKSEIYTFFSRIHAAFLLE